MVALLTAGTTRPELASIWFGLIWLAAWSLALVKADRIAEAVERRPGFVWLIPGIAFLGMLPALLDGGYPGSLATQPVWLVAVAASLARWTLVLATGIAAFAGKALVFALTGSGPEPFGEGAPLEARTAVLLPLALVPLTIALMSSVKPLAGLFWQAAGAANGLEHDRSGEEILLTPAEIEIVNRLAEGFTPKEIALQRQTSVETVRTQIKQARKKIGARTTDELVARTWRPG